MNYTIDIPIRVYTKWKIYKDFTNSNAGTFNAFVINTNNEYITAISKTKNSSNGGTVRTMTFKSEAHYTWFLLQQ